jgi:hypothetical protein
MSCTFPSRDRRHAPLLRGFLLPDHRQSDAYFSLMPGADERRVIERPSNLTQFERMIDIQEEHAFVRYHDDGCFRTAIVVDSREHGPLWVHALVLQEYAKGAPLHPWVVSQTLGPLLDVSSILEHQGSVAGMYAAVA